MKDPNTETRRILKPLPSFDDKPPSSPRGLWEARLTRTQTGALRKELHNAAVILENAPEWAGTIAWDAFAERVMVVKSCPVGDPGPWKDTYDLQATIWLQGSKWKLGCGHDIVSRAVDAIAHEHPFHPLRDRLEALAWDGVPRLGTWTSTYLGADDTPVHREMGRAWLLSAVARAFVPGCQADSALILEGPQGKRKSTALRVLALGFFTDDLADVSNKDALIQLHGNWIIELSELDAISKADAAKVKAFISRRVDKFRAPYGRKVEEHARACVFAGTTNQNDYLIDETGGRRFWPIACGAIEVDLLSREVDQLWAEAVSRYKSGECTYITSPNLLAEVTSHTATRYQVDAWTDRVLAFAKLKGNVSVPEVLENLNIEIGRWTRTDQMKVSKILKANGYERYRSGTEEPRQWRYRPNQCPK